MSPLTDDVLRQWGGAVQEVPMPHSTVTGRFFRGALGDASATPLAQNLQASDAPSSTVVDLRQNHELAPGFSANLANVRSCPLHDPNFTRKARPHRDYESYREHFSTLRSLTNGLAFEISGLLNSGGTVAVLCQLGRDRTGILVDEVLRLSNVNIADRVRAAQDAADQISNLPTWVVGIIRNREETPEAFISRHHIATTALIDEIERTQT